MIKRIIEKKVLYLSKKYPVITITGPRQSGKTTLVQSVFPEYTYYTLENPETRTVIQNDPQGFFKTHKSKKLILDEIQHVPELLSYIQVITDKEKIQGQFILTGSQSIILSEKISQTLAGRTAILKLLPFSLKELNHIKRLKHRNFEEWIFSGFYPRIYDQNIDPESFYPFYFETYVQRDVRAIQNIRNLTLFSNFVRLCAGRIGQLIDYSSLANDTGVSVNTIKGWLAVLEASFVIILLHPYYRNFNKRIIKSPKLYFTDTGLASFLLNIKNPEQVNTHYLKGGLFENLIVNELLKQRYNEAKASNLWFYRDNNRNEIDCILEDVQLKALEIKSARTFSDSFTKGLDFLIKHAILQPDHAYVVYGGDDSFHYKEKKVLSWRSLNEV
jgi:predicted AAA+ superfamily ATPase